MLYWSVLAEKELIAYLRKKLHLHTFWAPLSTRLRKAELAYLLIKIHFIQLRALQTIQNSLTDLIIPITET